MQRVSEEACSEMPQTGGGVPTSVGPDAIRVGVMGAYTRRQKSTFELHCLAASSKGRPPPPPPPTPQPHRRRRPSILVFDQTPSFDSPSSPYHGYISPTALPTGRGSAQRQAERGGGDAMGRTAGRKHAPRTSQAHRGAEDRLLRDRRLKGTTNLNPFCLRSLARYGL